MYKIKKLFLIKPKKMKKFLFLLVSFLTITTTVYASFPVSEQSTEQSIGSQETTPSLISAVRGGGPGLGIAALCCGILGFIFMPYLLGPLAIVFGALGLKNDGKGMAIAGLVLGILQVFLLLIVVLLVGAALGAGFY